MRKRPSVVTAYYKDSHGCHWWIRVVHPIGKREWHGEIRFHESCVGWDDAVSVFSDIVTDNRNPAPFEWVNRFKARLHGVSCNIGSVWTGGCHGDA